MYMLSVEDYMILSVWQLRNMFKKRNTFEWGEKVFYSLDLVVEFDLFFL